MCNEVFIPDHIKKQYIIGLSSHYFQPNSALFFFIEADLICLYHEFNCFFIKIKDIVSVSGLAFLHYLLPDPVTRDPIR